MKRKNGFTLIEVLGVIILLGILSVIVVPVVSDNIKKSKIKAYDKQVNTILTTAKEWAAANTDALNGNYFLIKVETLKKSGLLENKQIINPVTNEEMQGCAKVNYNEEFNQYEYEYLDKCAQEQILTSEDDCINEGKGICNPGVLVNVQVKDSKNYNFYVISDDGNELTMIMDRNLGNVAWVNNVDYNDAANFGYAGNNNKGPITVLNFLNKQTKDWDNIPIIINYTYDNNPNGTRYTSGYQKLVIEEGKGKLISQNGQDVIEIDGESKARLLTEEEATMPAIGCSTSFWSCPSWMYENLSSSNKTGPIGYWLLTAESSSSVAGRIITKITERVDIDNVSAISSYGLRPVITVPKNNNIY